MTLLSMALALLVAAAPCVPNQSSVDIFRAGHPGWLRCSFLEYSRYSRSSRLAIRAPRSGKSVNGSLIRDTSERPAKIVEGADAPARITRATVLTPAEGPPIVVYAAMNVTAKQLDTITVMAFVFKADGTLKARQAAPARRTLEPNETKYSTLVVDGGQVDPTDVIVIGINQAQHAGSDAWWRTDLQRAAEAAVPLKKP